MGDGTALGPASAGVLGMWGASGVRGESQLRFRQVYVLTELLCFHKLPRRLPTLRAARSLVSALRQRRRVLSSGDLTVGDTKRTSHHRNPRRERVEQLDRDDARSVIHIAIAGYEPRRFPVRATVLEETDGVLAVHEQTSQEIGALPAWCVSHVPTGYKIGPAFPKEREAVAFALRLWAKLSDQQREAWLGADRRKIQRCTPRSVVEEV